MNKVTLGSFSASERAKQLVMEVLESGRLSYGEKSAEYESEFANFHGCSHGVVSNSGTSSLQVALQALKEMYGWEERKSEVIVPALTFVATVNIVLHNNLKPVFVDIDPIDYTIDVSKIIESLTPSTVAIMPVHLFGHPAAMDRIMEIATGYGLHVVEDACEAMLAGIGGKKVGSFGDVGCFSTYAAHHMVTGVGGMAVTSNEKLALHMRSLCNHGIATGGLPTGERYDPSFLGRKFTFDKIGHSFRITELEAAIGLAQMEVVKDQIAKRKQNAQLITDTMKDLGLPVRLPKVKDGYEHTWMVYPIVLDRGINKRMVMRNLNDLGVETRDMMPLINQPCYDKLGIVGENFPTASFINDHGFYVGCHQDLTEQDIAYLVDSVNESIVEFAR